MKRPIRVLIAKPGLDGHDRGAKVVAKAIQDAGMEVIYTGLHQSAEQIVTAAIEEDVDVLGLSILCGSHLGMVERVIDRLKEQKVRDLIILVGGTIPRKDIPQLKALGVTEVFPTGSSFGEITNFINENVWQHRGSGGGGGVDQTDSSLGYSGS